ncbi:MAG TPA: hypothetical protein VFO11_08935 [Candidatus Polarisedimenticolaceae bacterium]|nr:hypothetical protein [Candidatus Polarisedimenticolaceae bacterium]
MRRRPLWIVPATLAFLLLASCSSSEKTEEGAASGTTETAPAEDAGPKVEDTVKAFYEHLNAGQQTEALALYTEANRTAMSAPDSGFADWAKGETKDGTLQSVEVEPVAVPGNTVTVPFTLVYKDGSKELRAVEAYRIGGTWMLGQVTTR